MTTTAVPPKVLRDAVPVLPKGRVWSVRDYHTMLEQRAIAGATISWGYVSMTAATTVMATAGLLLNSPAAVIGAMCVAPVHTTCLECFDEPPGKSGPFGSAGPRMH